MAFHNRSAILVNAPFFERDIRRTFNRRCDYRKLLEFFSSDKAEQNAYNNDDRKNDLVRAVYFHAQTKFGKEGLVRLESDGHMKFLSALRLMGYEVDASYSSVDAHLCTTACEIAQSGTVDTIFFLGVTIDHVRLIWHLRSQGIRVIGVTSNLQDQSDRIRDSLHWCHQIRLEDSILGDEVANREEIPEGDDRDNPTR